jgi:hypothetical protein
LFPYSQIVVEIPLILQGDFVFGGGPWQLCLSWFAPIRSEGYNEDKGYRRLPERKKMECLLRGFLGK